MQPAPQPKATARWTPRRKSGLGSSPPVSCRGRVASTHTHLSNCRRTHTPAPSGPDSLSYERLRPRVPACRVPASRRRSSPSVLGYNTHTHTHRRTARRTADVGRPGRRASRLCRGDSLRLQCHRCNGARDQPSSPSSLHLGPNRPKALSTPPSENKLSLFSTSFVR